MHKNMPTMLACAAGILCEIAKKILAAGLYTYVPSLLLISGQLVEMNTLIFIFESSSELNKLNYPDAMHARTHVRTQAAILARGNIFVLFKHQAA